MSQRRKQKQKFAKYFCKLKQQLLQEKRFVSHVYTFTQKSILMISCLRSFLFFPSSKLFLIYPCQFFYIIYAISVLHFKLIGVHNSKRIIQYFSFLPSFKFELDVNYTSPSRKTFFTLILFYAYPKQKRYFFTQSKHSFIPSLFLLRKNAFTTLYRRVQSNKQK